MAGRTSYRWFVCASAATILTGAVSVSDPIVFGQERVGGLNELVIYDPGKHDSGLPAIEFHPSVDGTQIDIQPTLHVHRFYYNGDKEYQGPLMKGGPTVLVANHPRSGKRLYIDVNLPAGAPLIVYSKTSITYVYQDRRVVIAFPCLTDEKVDICYLPGRGTLRSCREHVHRTGQCHQAAEQRLGLSQTLHDAGQSIGKTVCGTAIVAGQAAAGAIDHVKKTIEALPPVMQIQSAADQRAENALRTANTRAQQYIDQNAPNYVPTIR